MDFIIFLSGEKNSQDEVMGEDGLEDSQDAQVPWMGKSWLFMVFVHVFDISKMDFDIF
jgi:hypothetical protein